MEIGLISILFGVHQPTLCSWGDISVLFILWQCSRRLSGTQWSKSILLMCLIGKTELLCKQGWGSGPHLLVRGKSHGFSGIVAGTCGIFSSYGWDVHSKLEFVQRSQDPSLGMTNTSGKERWLGMTIRMFWRSSGRSGLLFSLAQWYWDSYQFSRTVRLRHILKHWTLRASRSFKWC